MWDHVSKQAKVAKRLLSKELSNHMQAAKRCNFRNILSLMVGSHFFHKTMTVCRWLYVFKRGFLAGYAWCPAAIWLNIKERRFEANQRLFFQVVTFWWCICWTSLICLQSVHVFSGWCRPLEFLTSWEHIQPRMAGPPPWNWAMSQCAADACDLAGRLGSLQRGFCAIALKIHHDSIGSVSLVALHIVGFIWCGT